MTVDRKGVRGYKVEVVAGDCDGWRVRFFIDGEDVGGRVYRTAEEADDAGVDFMFDSMDGGFYG